MKSPQITLCILGVLLCLPLLAQEAVAQAVDPGSDSRQASIQQDTPALGSIAEAKQQITADPNKVQAYNDLAIAFLHRARETADPKYIDDADAALAQGLNLDATDFQLLKTQVALLLSRHEYPQALEQALALHRSTPDDVITYGYIAEADIAQGNYPDAETNAQWMMNMRPYNTPALLLGARLRTLYGDTRGAIEFLSRAFSQTSPAEAEDLAWIANQIAAIQIDSGQNDAAEQTLAQAEQIFPGYPFTTENLARVRMAQNRADLAVQLWKKASANDRDPDVLYELARAQEEAGQAKEARATYSEFETLASAPASSTEHARLDLILMYAESPATAPKALELARQEIAARQDVWTLDAYAWALYANGDFPNADAAVQKSIAVGIQSAQIFDHAGRIAQKLNQSANAAKYFQLSTQTNPSSQFAEDARKSAGLAAASGNLRQEASQFIPAPVLSQTAASHPSLPVVADLQNPAAASGVAGTMASPAIFAQVPEALTTPQPTGTNQLIRSAQAALARDPKDAQGYAGLGAAYFQRARETGDVSDYQLAEESLNKSLDLVSADFSADAALGTMAEVCMGEHRFADALSYAQKALSLGTGDVSPFAIVGDAYADMGEYDKAGIAYGRLTPRDMTLSPRAAYARDSRLAYLRFVAGDTVGAIALMKTAVAEGVEAQLPSENLAWLYYELGEFDAQAGDVASADEAYLAALNTHPGDYRALAALARLQANNGRLDDAIGLYKKAIAVVPMPVFISELGDLYVRQGNRTEAQKQYSLVEYIGLLGHINQVLHNRDLALFYADHDMKLDEALSLAQKELEVRHDIYTWDALAWALYKNGKFAEAAAASQKATQFGTRDSLLLFHAGMIAEKLGQRKQAQAELKQALQINPHFHLLHATTAQEKLAALEAQSGSKDGSNEHGR